MRRRYLDLEVGRARLTQVPLPPARRLDPRKYVVVDLGDGLMTAILLVKRRDLAARYPRANIVTLICWDEEPILAAGDAEAVFLSAT